MLGDSAVAVRARCFAPQGLGCDCRVELRERGSDPGRAGHSSVFKSLFTSGDAFAGTVGEAVGSITSWCCFALGPVSFLGEGFGETMGAVVSSAGS